jgi:hypothetical protein
MKNVSEGIFLCQVLGFYFIIKVKSRPIITYYLTC